MRIKRIDWAYLAVPLSLLLAVLTVCSFTGTWPWDFNPYNSYNLQCRAWLAGQLDLGQDYPWLQLAIYEGKYYVSFPPFPSYVLLPFVALFDSAVPDGVIALFISMLGAVAGVHLVRKLSPGKPWLLYLLMDWYLASGWLFIGVNGWVWFIAQSMCFALSMMALALAKSGRGAISLMCWACSVGCRPMMVVYLPILLYLLYGEEKKKHPDFGLARMVVCRWWWALPCTAVAVSYMVLNACRFGKIWQFGHNYLPQFTRVSTGQFNWCYIRQNWQNILRLPTLKESGELAYSTLNGMAFYLANPMLIFAFASWVLGLVRWCRARQGSLFLLVCVPVCVIIHTLILLSHRTMGGWQFGCRYLVDLMPYVFLGVLVFLGDDDRLQPLALMLGGLGFALNAIGTVMTYNGML